MNCNPNTCPADTCEGEPAGGRPNPAMRGWWIRPTQTTATPAWERDMGGKASEGAWCTGAFWCRDEEGHVPHG